MGMLHTIRGSYESMRSGDLTADDTALDGETAGLTYHWHDKPAQAFALGEEYNKCEIIFTGGFECADLTDNADTTDNGTFAFKFYAYTEQGPAEFVADISGTVGTARIADSTLALYVDSLTIDSQAHPETVAVKDSGNNRIAKLIFGVLGYKYLYAEGYDVSYAPRPWIRPI